MAQFTAHGRLKFPFNNDGASWKLLGNDFVGGLRSFQSQKRKIRFLGTSGTRLYAASSLSKKPKHFYTEASQSVSEVNDDSEEDYERDELACFRGLVLDISYRYCSSRENLTIDHVLPTARGGEWKWENLVAACAKCNSKKGQKTPEEANMKLSKVPKAPKDYDILAIPLTSAAIRMLRMRKGMPEEWQQYLARPSSEP